MTISGYEYDRLAFNEYNAGYFYNQGYAVGYEWLNPTQPYAYNFKHPSVPGGYIPGGPSFGTMVRRGKGWERDNPQDKAFVPVAANSWRRGFIDGINQYVQDNRLDYPMIEHSRW